LNRIVGTALSFAAALALACAPAVAAVPKFDHIVIIMLENHSQSSVIGNPAAPQLSALAKKYAYAANYYGVTHPSLPNYIAITSGNNWYSNSDDPAQRFDHVNLVDQLEAAHVSWTAYMESMPSAGFTGAYYPANESTALYVARHNPFVLYTDVRSNLARLKHDVPLTRLATDLAGGRLSQFVWISPNVCRDMHGQPDHECPYSNDVKLRSDGDAFVGEWVKKITGSKAWTKNSVIFVMTDETDYDGNKATGGWLNADACCDSPSVPPAASFFPAGGQYGGGLSPFVAIGNPVKRGYAARTPYNHYSVLRTIEDAWHLSHLGMTTDTINVKGLDDMFASASGKKAL
jgi:phospholipase C